MRRWRIEYEPDQQHVSRVLKTLGLTDGLGVATPGIDDVGRLMASEISELRRTAKWRETPADIKEEEDLLTGEDLKLFRGRPVQLPCHGQATPLVLSEGMN